MHNDNPHGTRLWRCRCREGQQCRQPYLNILALQRDIGEVCYEPKHSIQSFAQMASLFYNPYTCTMGRNSIISDQAPISSIQYRGSKFVNKPGEVSLRLGSVRGKGASRCVVVNREGRNDIPQLPSMHVYSADGIIVHRTDVHEMDDVMTLMSACHDSAPLLSSTNKQAESTTSDNVISFADYRQMSKSWYRRSRDEHLDDLIVDGGVSRYKQLVEIDESAAFQVDANVLPWFLEYLYQQSYPFSRMVPQPGILQSSSGPIGDFAIDNDFIYLYSQQSIMVMDLQAIGEVWAVNYLPEDPVSSMALEFYDKSGACMGLFTGADSEGSGVDTFWNRLVLSLPSLSYRDF